MQATRSIVFACRWLPDVEAILTSRSRGRGLNTSVETGVRGSAESWQEPAPRRVRLDPYDRSTMRHLGECEFKDVSDSSILKALLKVTPKDGYSWVECGACSGGWQVLDYAA